MSALTDVAKQAMEYFCDRGSVDTYSEEWGFYLALRDALAQEPNPQMHEKSLGAANSAGMDALLYAAQQALEALKYAEAQRDALRAELREATAATNDPAVNNLRTLPESIRMLRAERDELLEALQDLCNTLGECGMTEKARAAIAKATGEAT